MSILPLRAAGRQCPAPCPTPADARLIAAHAAISAMTPAELAALILCETNGQAARRPALRLAAVRLAGLAQGIEVAQ